MDLVVISDLHLGSSYCLRDKLLKFLRELPDGPDLVLNGDVIDRWTKELSPEDEEVMTLLRDECSRRRVFWLPGNHDKMCRIECPTGDIEFAENIPVEGRLFISHGDGFDNMLSYGRPITAMLRWLYRIRLKLGCKPMHVATYGKTWPRLYDIIRLHVLHNAVMFALRKGYPAITCGHSHFAEDTVVKGVRYINTGAWTELPAYAVWVTDNEIRFEQVSS